MAQKSSSGSEPVELGVRVLFVAAAVALVVRLALHQPAIAKWILLAGLALAVRSAL